jgi:hypothetical protein
LLSARSSIRKRCSSLVYISFGFSFENKYCSGTSDRITTCGHKTKFHFTNSENQETHSNSVVIERVDQRDEPPRLRLQLQVQLRHVSDDDCVEILRELDVIAGAQRPIANLTERRVKYLTARLLEGDVSPEMREGFGTDSVSLLAAEDFEDSVDVAFRVRIGFPAIERL